MFHNWHNFSIFKSFSLQKLSEKPNRAHYDCTYKLGFIFSKKKTVKLKIIQYNNISLVHSLRHFESRPICSFFLTYIEKKNCLKKSSTNVYEYSFFHCNSIFFCIFQVRGQFEMVCYKQVDTGIKRKNLLHKGGMSVRKNNNCYMKEKMDRVWPLHLRRKGLLPTSFDIAFSGSPLILTWSP